MTDKPTFQCGIPERSVIYAWEGEVAGLRAENERLREVLSGIAAQKQSSEIENNEVADYEYAYNFIVGIARAALGKE